MALSEFEHARLEKSLQQFCEEKGPPAHLRGQLSWGFTVDPVKQTVHLFEVRPHFMEKDRMIQSSIAKASFVKSSKMWKVYWMRGTGKWILYEPYPEALTIEEFLKVVKEDEHHCFFG
jgi:hypothetical protein